VRELISRLPMFVDRYKNSKGIDVGRIGKSDASWLARLMDHEMLEVTGFAAEVPNNFRSGTSLNSPHPSLSLSPLLFSFSFFFLLILEVGVVCRSRYEFGFINLDLEISIHESQPLGSRTLIFPHLINNDDQEIFPR